MSRVDVERLLEPVSEARPCGPDLDAEGDMAFTGLIATVEGLLPAAYFSFDPSSIDADWALSEGAALLRRTRDIRLLVLMSKVAVLYRDLDTFADAVEGVHRLLAERWDSVHPLETDGDFLFRMAPLYTLDDNAPVLMPLQYLPLAEGERSGRATYRARLVALGEAKPRTGETLPDAGQLDRIFEEADLTRLRATHAALGRLRAALAGIRTVSVEHAGFDQAVRLEKLPPLVDDVYAYVHEQLLRRDPSVGEIASVATPDGDEAAGEQGRADEPAPVFATSSMTSREADALLGAALDYFEALEPSSPAVPLLRQARSLVGKNLREVMQILFPGLVDTARIQVGGDQPFVVAIGTPGAAVADGDGEAAQIAPIASRKAAVAAMEAVAAHFRAQEPSSPIPMLIDRARTLSSKDFTSLLKELLP